jgi:hypothetical protein
MYITEMVSGDKTFQAILRFGLNNMNGCNVGITERRDL